MILHITWQLQRQNKDQILELKQAPHNSPVIFVNSRPIIYDVVYNKLNSKQRLPMVIPHVLAMGYLL